MDTDVADIISYMRLFGLNQSEGVYGFRCKVGGQHGHSGRGIFWPHRAILGSGTTFVNIKECMHWVWLC